MAKSRGTRLSGKTAPKDGARRAIGPVAKPAKIKVPRFDHADSFMALWRMRAAIAGKSCTGNVSAVEMPDYGLVREHQFAGRKWRFDIAWPELMVAVELEGGHWTGNSRHTRGSGFAADCEKYSTAAALGWRVLRFTGDDLKKRPSYVIGLVLRALAFGRMGGEA